MPLQNPQDLASHDALVTGVHVAAKFGPKEFWVAGNFILGSSATRSAVYRSPAVVLADAVVFAGCFYGFRVPNDFSNMLAAHPKLLLYATASGDVRLEADTEAGASGEAINARSDAIAEYTQAVVANQLLEVDISAAFDGLTLAAGDLVGIEIRRDSDDASDTLVGVLNLLGIMVRYE